jgi:hypothetical protein
LLHAASAITQAATANLLNRISKSLQYSVRNFDWVNVPRLGVRDHVKLFTMPGELKRADLTNTEVPSTFLQMSFRHLRHHHTHHSFRAMVR